MPVRSYISEKLSLFIHETYSNESELPRFVVEIKNNIEGTRKVLNYLTWEEVAALEPVAKYII